MAEKSFPFHTKEIDQAQVDELRKYYNGVMNLCNVRYGPRGYILPQEFKEFGKDIYNMEVRPEDTFVVTFPKSGTTWTQEMVWLIANNFDYEKAIKIPLNIRFPFLDVAMFLNSPSMEATLQDDKFKQAAEAMAGLSIKDITALPNPRFLKSHLPFSLLSPKLLDTTKVVYVARDPRDVVVSFYHHSKLTRAVRDDMNFKDFWRLFIKDLVAWTPFFPHVKEAWEVRNHPNMLFLFYEEISKEFFKFVLKVTL